MLSASSVTSIREPVLVVIVLFHRPLTQSFIPAKSMTTAGLSPTTQELCPGGSIPQSTGPGDTQPECPPSEAEEPQEPEEPEQTEPEEEQPSEENGSEENSDN
jgi:hypothetical protein